MHCWFILCWDTGVIIFSRIKLMNSMQLSNPISGTLNSNAQFIIIFIFDFAELDIWTTFFLLKCKIPATYSLLIGSPKVRQKAERKAWLVGIIVLGGVGMGCGADFLSVKNVSYKVKKKIYMIHLFLNFAKLSPTPAQLSVELFSSNTATRTIKRNTWKSA